MAGDALARAIAGGIAGLGQDAGPETAERLAAFVDLLARWNRAYNLSAVRDPAAMVTRHVVDCLAIRPWLRRGALLDLGTGPGLPGIVVAIAEPGRPVTLLDSNGKKTRFLRQAVLELGLEEVSVVQARAGDWAAPGAFATVTARAFTDLARFWHLAGPYLAEGGAALAMKGRYPADELAALPAEGVSSSAHRIAVPGLDGERHLVIMEPAVVSGPPHRFLP